MASYVWGPLSRLGLAIAVLALVSDQANKWWMLNVYKIAERGRVAVTPFLDFVMVWNPGVSYGLFPQGSDAGRYALIGCLSLIVLGLWVWLAQARTKLAAVGLGFIIGGAIGNIIDRIVYGAVADFYSFHLAGYYWYVFNVADTAIVAGAALLLYDSLLGDHKKVSKAP